MLLHGTKRTEYGPERFLEESARSRALKASSAEIDARGQRRGDHLRGLIEIPPVAGSSRPQNLCMRGFRAHTGAISRHLLGRLTTMDSPKQALDPKRVPSAFIRWPDN